MQGLRCGLKAAATTQTVCLPGEEVTAWQAADLARKVTARDDRIKTADADIADRLCRHPLTEVITCMPGMGFRLGAEFLAAVGDPALIGPADRVAARAGLSPVSRDCGKRTARRCTSKRYSRRRRRVLYTLIRDNRPWQPGSPPITKAAA